MGLKGALLFCTKIHTDGDYKMTQNAWTFSASVQIAGGVRPRHPQNETPEFLSTFSVLIVVCCKPHVLLINTTRCRI